MQIGDEVSLGISRADRGRLVKMFITLKSHGISEFDQNCLLIHFKTVWPLVCKTGPNLCRKN